MTENKIRINVAEPDITRDDIAEVVYWMNKGWVSGIAPQIAMFEQKFAE